MVFWVRVVQLTVSSVVSVVAGKIMCRMFDWVEDRVSSFTVQTSTMLMLNSRLSVLPFHELFSVILALNFVLGLNSA